MKIRMTLWLCLLVFTAGCSVNPVTGESELILVSGAQEIAMGEQNYLPMRQSQGGTYDVDPALNNYVRDVGNRVAAASGVNLPYEFSVLNNSVPNAWALPGGKIAINRGLLAELNSEAELAAVLGHEVVHAAARHSAQQMSRGMLLQGLVIGTAIATSDSDYGNLAVGGANVAAQLLSLRYSRGAELESDLYGMRYMSKAGYDPQGAVTLQETFVRLSEGRNQSWLAGLFSSHPPSPERVAANRQTAAMLPPGGTLGVDSYQAAMRQTRELKPAYDSYDEGRKALAKKDLDKALTLANEALRQFNGEAHFHALRGDIRLVTDKHDMAVTNYSRAIDRREDFFYYHLQRGLARKELKQTDAAIVDLERSIELLPTAPAHYALGTIKEQRGQRAAAVSHYKAVADSGGDYGKAATARLMRLELPTNPGDYIPRRCDADAEGNLIVSVKNETSLIVTDVQIAVQYSDSAGRSRQLIREIRSQIAPGQIASVNTGLGPYTGGACPAQVVSARVVE